MQSAKRFTCTEGAVDPDEDFERALRAVLRNRARAAVTDGGIQRREALIAALAILALPLLALAHMLWGSR